VQLNPGESKHVTVTIPSLYLSIYDEASSSWKLLPGGYSFMAGGSSQDLPLSTIRPIAGMGFIVATQTAELCRPRIRAHEELSPRISTRPEIAYRCPPPMRSCDTMTPVVMISHSLL
jgi:hypothetical protein